MRIVIDIDDSVSEKVLWLLKHLDGEISVCSTCETPVANPNHHVAMSIDEFEKEYIR